VWDPRIIRMKQTNDTGTLFDASGRSLAKPQGWTEQTSAAAWLVVSEGPNCLVGLKESRECQSDCGRIILAAAQRKANSYDMVESASSLLATHRWSPIKPSCR